MENSTEKEFITIHKAFVRKESGMTENEYVGLILSNDLIFYAIFMFYRLFEDRKIQAHYKREPVY